MEKTGISFRQLKRALCIISALVFILLPPNPASAMIEVEVWGDNVFASHENSQMKIALTFDDGPHPRYTDEILEILEKYNIHATFFEIGENVSYYPEITKRVIDAGHEIGNHTYSHPRLNMSKYSVAELEKQLLRTERLIYETDEYRPKLFRPPEGRCCGTVADIAKKMDYSVILWTIDTYDWRHTPPQTIAANVVSSIRSGDIILCHDGITKDSPTPAALEIFIPKLIEMGYKFVTVSELLLSE